MLCASRTFTGTVQERSVYLEALNSTTSLDGVPRETRSCFPSGDHANREITPEVKCVTCTGLPPSSGMAQTFPTPPSLRPYVMLRPSGDHTGMELMNGNVCSSLPSSVEWISKTKWLAWKSKFGYAKR